MWDRERASNGKKRGADFPPPFFRDDRHFPRGRKEASRSIGTRSVLLFRFYVHMHSTSSYHFPPPPPLHATSRPPLTRFCVCLKTGHALRRIRRRRGMPSFFPFQLDSNPTQRFSPCLAQRKKTTTKERARLVLTDGWEQSAALLAAIKEYETSKWKVIGAKVGKPAKVCQLLLLFRCLFLSL